MEELFPGSAHVFHSGLERFASDEAIWEYARAFGFAIVTADTDFARLAQTRGSPPKVVRLENCKYKTAEVENILRRTPFALQDWTIRRSR